MSRPKTSPVVVTVMTAHNAVLISPTKRPRGVLYGLPAPSACLASASPSQFLFFDAASCVLFSARVTKAQFCNQALAAPAPSRRSRRAHRALRFRCVRTVGRCAVERGHSGGAARVVARQSSQPRVIQLILRLSVLKVLRVFHTLPFLGGTHGIERSMERSSIVRSNDRLRFEPKRFQTSLSALFCDKRQLI